MAQVGFVAPSMVANESWRRGYMRSARLSVSRSAAVSSMRNVLDTRVPPVLPSVQAPTLVVDRRGDRHIRVEHGRYLAEHIRGAQFWPTPNASSVTPENYVEYQYGQAILWQLTAAGFEPLMQPFFTSWSGITFPRIDRH